MHSRTDWSSSETSEHNPAASEFFIHSGRRSLWSCVLTTLALVAGPLATEPAICSTNEQLVQIEHGSAAFKSVREPAVAGLFYPKNPDDLARMIDGFLAAAPAGAVSDLKAIVCPHAGYEYSGKTAAYAYKLLVGRRIKKVIILAPSHYALFEGASIPRVEAYRTPLGLVPISPESITLAKADPCRLEPACRVQRPAWWRESSRNAPEPGTDTPDTWEHSAEVQVPFLQKVLTNFTILPVVFGQVAPAQVARAIDPLLDASTLVVVSSDLSHYHPYKEAKELDDQCIKAICRLDVDAMETQEACGKAPILALLQLARERGWQARLLDYRNSGDTSGDKRGVVGYSAVAFFAAAPEKFTGSERKQLLALARQSLKEAVDQVAVSPLQTNGWPRRFFEPRGCFVTLTKAGELRGCIGHIFPQEPLFQAVQDNARSAAVRDPRFPPVTSTELAQVEVEVSVLTEPRPLAFSSPEDLLNKLEPAIDGVVLKLDGRAATFLPQVWKELPGKTVFLDRLCQKAGGEPADWRKPGTSVLIYHVEAFKESDR